jgi:NADH-quinone oxidoreductase subunit C
MSEIKPASNLSRSNVVARLQQEFPDAIQETIRFRDELTVVVDPSAVVEVCTLLREDPNLGFNYMCDLSGVDLWPAHPRFEVNVHLLAMPHDPQPAQGTHRIRVKVRLDEENASMPSLTGVWPSVAWYERETHELFGIDFEGHPDLRPLLLPEDWEGDPPLQRHVAVKVEEVAFSFNQDRIYRDKPFARE